MCCPKFYQMIDFQHQHVVMPLRPLFFFRVRSHSICSVNTACPVIVQTSRMEPSRLNHSRRDQDLEAIAQRTSTCTRNDILPRTFRPSVLMDALIICHSPRRGAKKMGWVASGPAAGLAGPHLTGPSASPTKSTHHKSFTRLRFRTEFWK